MPQPLIRFQDIQYYLANYRGSRKSEIPLRSNLAYAQRKFLLFDELMQYLGLRDYVLSEVERLKCILEGPNEKKQIQIETWFASNRLFFSQKLIGFGLAYLDSGSDENGSLHLPSIGEYVDKEPFLPLIQYWECMWLLLSYDDSSVEDNAGFNCSYYRVQGADTKSSSKQISELLNRWVEPSLYLCFNI